uniref:cation-transporting ATPase 13A2 isoform X3 n=1 Tax=Podarcis muralis TaxID=64176 RepID=UPI0010A093BC|nr:cation-transporting ATPase 13A2 isoform X3 [Podarcis muralis]
MWKSRRVFLGPPGPRYRGKPGEGAPLQPLRGGTTTPGSLCARPRPSSWPAPDRQLQLLRAGGQRAGRRRLRLRRCSTSTSSSWRGAMSSDTKRLLGGRRLGYCTLNQSPPNTCMEVTGYQSKTWKIILCHFFSLLTLGIPLIVFHWKPHFKVRAKCSRCPLHQADWVVIRDQFGQYFTACVRTEQMVEGSLEYRRDGGGDSIAVGVFEDEDESRDTIGLHRKEEKNVLRYYQFEGLRYVWIEKWGAFCKASVLDEGWTFSDIHLSLCGLSAEEQAVRRKIYGRNLIDVPVNSYFRLLRDEVLNPFYIFQIFSIVLWSFDEYYYYAACIFLISAVSIGISLYETRKQSITLQKMVKMAVNLQIRRASGEIVTVSSMDLVPGDCIVVPVDGLQVPCDAALLTGECLVNESMLTGESIPVMKTSLPEGPQATSTVYSPEEHKRHTLFCGTQVIQARPYVGPEVLAVVTRTGFYTAKGDLISSILHPKPLSFRFYKDAWKFVGFLTVLAAIGTGYSIYILYRNKETLRQIILRALDVVTVIVPPALPAAMTVGTIYAQNRLKQQGIFCISPPRINLCGKVRLVCFDKIQEETEGDAAEAQATQLFGTRALAVMRPPPVGEQLHGKEHLAPVAILRRFPFSSALQRMSVLVKPTGGGPSQAYMKGSPEMVASLCDKESVPADFTQTLRHFTSDGFRVLGLAFKPLAAIGTFEEAQDMTRDDVESGMVFLGFLVMKNVLKPQTAPVIHLLHNADIRTVMVTGDNMLTAVNVARSCRMVNAKERVLFVHAAPPRGRDEPAALRFVPYEHHLEQPDGSYQRESYFLEQQHPYHLAVNGQSFAVLCDHFPDLLPKILVRATIFARMSPDQKTLLVQNLRDLNYCVGMCGDGANDCGALKAADVGISLSEAEASVASPFTSKIANIECVPIAIREGRCSLVTSFAVFKYMALYSLVQFVSVLLLYTINTNLSDLQFLFFDLIITTTVAALMGRTAPANDLGPKRPQGALINIIVLSSLAFQTSLFIAIQVTSYYITVSQLWYVPLNSTVAAPQNLPNYENTVVFCISGFQYLILAVAMSKGQPFRKPLYTNNLPGLRASQRPPEPVWEKVVEEALQKAGEGAEPAAALVASAPRTHLCHPNHPCHEVTLGADTHACVDMKDGGVSSAPSLGTGPFYLFPLVATLSFILLLPAWQKTPETTLHPPPPFKVLLLPAAPLAKVEAFWALFLSLAGNWIPAEVPCSSGRIPKRRPFVGARTRRPHAGDPSPGQPSCISQVGRQLSMALLCPSRGGVTQRRWW